MHVLEQGKVSNGFGKSGPSKGSDCEKDLDIKMDGKPSRGLSPCLPSVLETLFFPSALTQCNTIRMSAIAPISEIYHVYRVKCIFIECRRHLGCW